MLCYCLAGGYKYSYSKVITFCLNQNAGAVLPGPQYTAKYWKYDGTKVKKRMGQPVFIIKYHKRIGVIDNHNMIQQGQLALEKLWKTHCSWYYIFTSLLGMKIGDCWLSIKWHMMGGANGIILPYSRCKDFTIMVYVKTLGSSISWKYKLASHVLAL